MNRNLTRLDQLFPRYWDGILSVAERQEFEEILVRDPESRHALLLLSMQVSAIAEGAAVEASRVNWLIEKTRTSLSRRSMLRLVGTGMAAALGGLALGLSSRVSAAGGVVELTAVRGVVRLNDPLGPEVTPGMTLRSGQTLYSCNPGSSAALSCKDGTTVCLTGDSALLIGDEGRRLVLRQGTATAEVAPVGGNRPMVLATPRTAIVSAEGATMTLGCNPATTRVGVQLGQVSVCSHSGSLLADVSEGEILTVGSKGGAHKQVVTPTPEEFSWPLDRPLPEGWAVGKRVVEREGAVIRPEFWYDPYHSAVMSQIRSDNQWHLGFVRLMPDSVIRVRYWVDTPGRGQLVMVVRTGDARSPHTGCLECNEAFVLSRPGRWQWLEVCPRDMLDNKEAPTFPAPYFAFLIIFNTYEPDLGLKVAELHVSRKGVLPG